MYDSYPTEEKNTSNKHSEDGTTRYLIDFGLLLVAIISILASKILLPDVVLYGLFGYLIIVLIIKLVGPIHKLDLIIRKKQNEKSLFVYFRPKLQRIIKDFTNITEDKSNTIPYLMREIIDWKGVKEPLNKVVNDDLTQNPLSYIKRNIDAIKTGAYSLETYFNCQQNNSFTEMVRHFGLIVRDYNDACTEVQKLFEKLVISGNLPDDASRHLKQEWNSRREKYSIFCNEWEKLGTDIKEKTEKDVYYYFVAPKTLE